MTLGPAAGACALTKTGSERATARYKIFCIIRVFPLRSAAGDRQKSRGEKQSRNETGDPVNTAEEEPPPLTIVEARHGGGVSAESEASRQG